MSAPLPPQADHLLRQSLAQGKTPEQAAIWARHVLGHPEQRWLELLLERSYALSTKTEPLTPEQEGLFPHHS